MKTVRTLTGRKGYATARLPWTLKRALAALALWLAYQWQAFVAFHQGGLAHANHRGSEGTVKFTTNVIAELRGWTLNMASEVIEDTLLSEAAKTFHAGNTEWSGTFTCFWDETDTNGQAAATAGASVTLNLYPEGDTTGDTYYSGAAIITGVTLSAAINGMVEAEYTFRGTGALTRSTV